MGAVARHNCLERCGKVTAKWEPAWYHLILKVVSAALCTHAWVALSKRGTMKFKTLVASVAFSVLGTAVAGAADLSVKAPPPPPLPVFSWTGFYVGGNIGGAWSRNTWTDTILLTNFNNGGNNGAFIGGGQVGVNYQVNNFVIGGEWDFDWAGNHNNGNGVITPAGTIVVQQQSLDHDTGCPLRRRRRSLAVLRQGRRWLGRQQRPDDHQPQHGRVAHLRQLQHTHQLRQQYRRLAARRGLRIRLHEQLDGEVGIRLSRVGQPDLRRTGHGPDPSRRYVHLRQPQCPDGESRVQLPVQLGRTWQVLIAELRTSARSQGLRFSHRGPCAFL